MSKKRATRLVTRFKNNKISLLNNLFSKKTLKKYWFSFISI